MRTGGARGTSLVELLVGITVFTMAMAAVAGILIQNSQMNKSEQMAADVQANARNSLSLIVERLRSAGWDPQNLGIQTVDLDSDLTDQVSYIEVFADFTGDGATTGPDEAVLIRHSNGTIAWRTQTGQPFVPLAANISNDADGDGNIEQMFVPDNTTSPTSVVVQITAESPSPDPVSGDFLRYTVQSEVTLRARI